jgi:hypothetical protein
MMARWDGYAEIDGSPFYFSFDNETEDEDDTFEQVVEHFRGTLQIDLEG